MPPRVCNVCTAWVPLTCFHITDANGCATVLTGAMLRLGFADIYRGRIASGIRNNNTTNARPAEPRGAVCPR